MKVRGLCAVAVAVWLLAAAPVWAAELVGQVTFNGQPVPGATVTATRPPGGQDGEVTKKVTASDPQGVYRFPDLAEGVWTISVQMFGFTPVTREIKIPPDAPPPPVELALLPLAEMTRGLVTQAAEPPVVAAPAGPRTGTSTSSSSGANAPAAAAGRGAGPGPRGGFQRAAANPNAAAAARRRRQRVPERQQRRSRRQQLGRGRWAAHQRQHQQRRRVTVRAGARVRQQPSRRTRPLQRRLRPAYEQLGARRAAVLDHGRAGAEAAIQRRALHRQLRRADPHPASHAPGPELLRQLPARAEPRRHDAVGADADCARARGRLLAVAQRVRPAGAPGRSGHRAAVRRQRHPGRSHQPAGDVAARVLPAAERRRAVSSTTRRRSSSGHGRYRPRPACTHQFRSGREQFQGVLVYSATPSNPPTLFSFVDTHADDATSIST